MNSWPYRLTSYSPYEVTEYCVQDQTWQQFRLSMKGETTRTKLKMLCGYYLKHLPQLGRKVEVQVSNYLNALKRGGQLDMDLKVKREL